MKKVLKVIAKLIFTYALCGGLYVMLELAWRGRSDISMLLLSGFLGLFAMFFNNIFSYETDYIVQVLSVSIIATFFEGLFGNVYNMDYVIWDYRNLPFSFWNSQINLIFFFFWKHWVTRCFRNFPVINVKIWCWFFHEFCDFVFIVNFHDAEA